MMCLCKFGQNLAFASQIECRQAFFMVIGSDIAEDYPDNVKSQLIRVHIVSCGLYDLIIIEKESCSKLV